ncbi:MAG: sigma-E processing peptidase SpoIIGA [Oscillospiraceae bacterium]|jgi:stage II sporulation protein GA (sporulation sigma-E factor processing peptidase)|nr:sigma-E processing peptidase SpoIIGA [Oscillospiraceae bacterium]
MYVDVLFAVNIYFTFFTIKAAGKILRQKPTRGRLTIALLLGGLSSLMIFLPNLPAIVNIAIKFAGSMAIAAAAFGLRRIIRTTVVFAAMNFALAGLMLCVYMFAAPFGMYFGNATAYFDLSFPLLVIVPAAFYTALKLLRYFLDVKFGTDKRYEITITLSGVEYALYGFADTGNCTYDFFTSLPVVFANEGIFPPQDKYRPFGIDTVTGGGTAKLIRPDRIIIGGKSVDAVLALTANTPTGIAIFNPKLLM